jgi:hypothetical protein
MGVKMARKNLEQLIASMIITGILWGVGYLWHDIETTQYPIPPVIKSVPRWLALICGRPQNKEQLEIGAVIVQVAAALQFVSLLSAFVWGVEFERRVMIIYFFSGGGVVASVLVRVLWPLLH